MTQLSKLIEQIKSAEQNNSGVFEISEDTICELTSYLEAAEAQEPVAFVKSGYALCYYRPPREYGLKIGDNLYAAPQPVAVPDDKQLRALFDAWFASDCSFDRSPAATEEDNIAWRESYWYVWQRCAAMLQPSSGALQLPDGWKIVPVEPTAEMISSGIAAHYERSQIQIHDRPAPGPMECAYVAMLSAAPVNPEFTTHLVGEVVAWHHPNHERNVDFRWLDFNVEPGTKLYAIKQDRS
ncbi:hypothetical protein [Enterobacter sp.]|uniref:hypothetical protein n=1 Tax=Enterobacter sp. TaxID=42895 RepID=UPI0029819028|nr:hypothetical protein [Enterobacter sp.]